MTNIAISDSHNYAIQQTQRNNIVKLSEDDNAPPLTTDVRSFVTLATQPGMMGTILHDQSVMFNINTLPALLTPPVGREKIDSEQKDELMSLITKMKGGDINKLERAAASAAMVFNAQINPHQTANSTAIGTKAAPVSSSSTAPATDATHARTPVEGGTDITAADASGGQFINITGDIKKLELSNLFTRVLTAQEGQFLNASAKASMRAVEAADRSGNKLIDAEKQRMTGAITSGSLGLVGQGITSTRTINALKTESKSINNNLASASRMEAKLGTHQSSIASSTDNLLHQGKSLSDTVSGKMDASASKIKDFSDTKRNDHNQIQLKTSQTRVTSDYSNVAVNSSQKVIDGAFNVEAANETKQAELARADQNVNNEISNTHQHAAKKSAESKAALNQAIENMMNSNNSTLSAIADRIR
ncbi:type III secretion system protein [uncultured Cedecea sp.]|uniref:type III secretion system protein n=1 Tax=uncultured Cedecea sp. TaxID=988762 RepID=UPI002627FDEC|nr:type III secretion system protein [uncultured Cedecea sp.]